MNKEIVLVGAKGTMGSAIASRFEASGINSFHGLTRESTQYDEIVQLGDMYFLCVKQDQIVEWLHTYGKQLKQDSVVLSLGAFVRIRDLEGHCGNKDVRIGRIMTTTGIKGGNEEIVWSSDGKFTVEQLNEANTVLAQLGNARYLGEIRDDLIDQKTYRACIVGLIADACERHVQALRSMGVGRIDSQEWVDNALAVILNDRQSGSSFETTRNDVMSVGGLTEAAVRTRETMLDAAVKNGMLAMKSRGENIAKRFAYQKGA